MPRLPRPALAGVLSALLLVVAAPGSAEPPAPARVHPWVLERTEAGRTVDVFVVLREQADLSGADRLATKVEKGWFVYDALTSVAERTQGPLRRRLAELGFTARPYWIVNQVLVEQADRRLVLELAARPDVVRIDGNPTVVARLPKPEASFDTASAGPEPQAVQWNVTKINAPGVWALGFRGAGIVVGGQDTGYRWTHNLIKSKYRGWDGTTASHDYNWHDSVHTGGNAGTCTGPNSAAPCDDDGHGTHTMGTVLGDAGTGNEYGAAPAAKWIGCRDMDRGAGTPARYLECFQFFLAPTKVDGTGADPSKAPDLTTNSWGCPASEGCAWDTLQAGADAQRAAGILTVAAAGNSGSSCGTVDDPPAMYASVYTVGSTTSSDAMSSFSSRGPGDGNGLMKPDVVAPGSSVTSAAISSDTATTTLSGTSMATPGVAGGVALFWSARPAFAGDLDATIRQLNCSARRLTSIVESCGGDYVNGPNNTWGYGLLDVLAAVNSVVSAPGSLLATPNGNNRIDLSWGAAAGAVSYEVRRGPSASGPWTTVATVAAPTTTHADLGVSGGATWFYVVRAVSGNCRSLDSPVASATATGPCTLAPAFAGLASVANPAGTTCSLSLAWSAASAGCGGATVSYDVFRSTDGAFTPGPANRVATGVAGTSYVDPVGLAGGTTYHYVVRAVDSVSGSADTNLARRSGVPTGPLAPGTWSAGAEAGNPAMTLEGSWTTSTSYKRTGSASYFSAYPNGACQSLVTPSIVLGNSPVLSWYHIHSLESGWDGVRVEASSDGGTNWTVLTPSPAYGSTITNAGNACSWPTTTPIWGGNSSGYPNSWQAASVALPGGWNGQTARFRWRFATDGSAAGSLTLPGFYVDDIQVTNAMVGGSCAVGSAARPVPDGKLVAGTAMKGTKGAGGTVDLSWNVTACTSPGFNLYRGLLGNFGTVTGGSCALGSSGLTTGTPMPGDSWWIVAGATASEVGSFGRTSAGAERSLTGWSGACPQAAQALTAGCP